MIWEHVEKNLKKFVTFLNQFHNSIKFTFDSSFEKVNFLDVKIFKKGNSLITDLFVKKTDGHQYLQPSSCHPYHCMKAIPYSQALRLNRICSEKETYDRRCNQLTEWLKERDYKEDVIKEQILRAKSFSRNTLLEKEDKKTKKDAMIFTLTYHPSLKGFQRVLKEAHILLTPNLEHRNVFGNTPPMIGWRKARTLKDHLVRAKITSRVTTCSKSVPCGSKICQVCSFINGESVFSDSENKYSFDIRAGVLNCNSDHIVYLFECKSCAKQYVGSTITKFRYRFNNYKSVFRRVSKSFPEYCRVNQEHFHRHFNQSDHNGMDDWKVTLIDKADNEVDLRKRESFWQYKLNTFLPHGLNERNVALKH